MNRHGRIIGLALAAVGIGTAAGCATGGASPRERMLMDFGWRFAAGDHPGAEAAGFDAAQWRTVDLPHDWSIEGRPEAKNPMGGAGGFLPSGVVWYRRTFAAPAAWKDRRVTVEFDGVYMNADIWLNGRHLASHPYGYTAFHVELTGHLNIGEANTLVVKVDNSRQVNSRWYSGTGIYRHVWLTVTDPVHVAPWGVFVHTPEIGPDSARVVVQTRLLNEGSEQAAVSLQTTLLGPDGSLIGEVSEPRTLEVGRSCAITQEVCMPRPALWSPETPNLYRAVTRVSAAGRIVDRVETPFGVRSIRISPERGFELNGKTLKLCGGCVHHDNGPLGAMAFDRAEERRVELLKAAGFNAIRTAHNPPSAAFLDACDRLGMLVMDESFDCWEQGKNPHDYGRAFKEWWARDIDAMVLRDRNHPSIFMWSIGNEVPQRADPEGLVIARNLIDRVRLSDSTRPVTQALCDFWDRPGRKWPDADPAFALLDAGGYNYTLEQHEADHQRAPTRIMIATESFPNATFKYWSIVQDQSYVIGDFVWTALDYLGESGIGRWKVEGEKDYGHADNALYPWHGSYCGDLDICCFRKPISYYRNIIWGRGERLYMAVRVPPPDGKKLVATQWGMLPALPSWTWPGREGKTLQVEVYSGCDAVQLFLGDKKLGERPTTRQEQFQALFEVPYAPGTLRAVGLEQGRPVAEQVLQTAGEPAKVRLTPDRADIRADGQDLSFITVEVTDGQGRPRLDAAHEITFSLSGPGTLLAVGNADMTSEEPYQGERRKVWQGRALAVVRASRRPGDITLTARSGGLADATVNIRARRTASSPVLP